MRVVPTYWLIDGLPVFGFGEYVRGLMTLIEREADGDRPGSLSDEPLRYYVLDGYGVQAHTPWLWEWARDVAVPIAASLAGRPLMLSHAQIGAVNINCLEGEGERYELHVDSIPYTMIVFASGPHSGGELLLEPPGSQVLIRPRPGRAVLFAGMTTPHAVLPMKEAGPRYSVPIGFEVVGEENERDGRLSEYLYGREEVTSDAS